MTERFVSRLVRDPVLQLPDAKRGEQQALGPRQGSDRWQISLAGRGAAAFPGAAALALGLTDTARAFTNGEMASVIHGKAKSSLRASA